MTALHSSRYRDPLDVLISEESRTCKGCKHVTEWTAFDRKIQSCAKGRKKRNSKCYEETVGVNCQGGK